MLVLENKISNLGFLNYLFQILIASFGLVLITKIVIDVKQVVLVLVIVN